MSLAQEAKRRQPKVFAAICEAVETAKQGVQVNRRPVNRGSTHRRRQNESPSKTQDSSKVDTCEVIDQHDPIVLSAVEEQVLIEGKQPYTKTLGDSIWEAPTTDTLPDLGQIDDDEQSEIDDESDEDGCSFADLEGTILDEKLEATANVSVEPLQLPGLAAALQESESLTALIALMQDAEELEVTKNDC